MYIINMSPFFTMNFSIERACVAGAIKLPSLMARPPHTRHVLNLVGRRQEPFQSAIAMWLMRQIAQ
jgi:hypothetical protein